MESTKHTPMAADFIERVRSEFKLSEPDFERLAYIYDETPAPALLDQLESDRDECLSLVEDFDLHGPLADRLIYQADRIGKRIAAAKGES